MDKKTLAWVLIIAGGIGYFFPEWQGVWLSSSNITAGDGRIIATLLFLGGLFLYYLPASGEK